MVVVVTGPGPGSSAVDIVEQKRQAAEGRMGMVAGRTFITGHHWALHELPWFVHAVRRPTEAELTAWVLSQPG